MKISMLLMAVVMIVGCVSNGEIERLTNDSAREVSTSKIETAVATPVQPVIETPVTATTTVPAIECRKDVVICYWLLNGKQGITVKAGTVVTLSWKFLNCTTSRTLWDQGRLPDEGTMELTINYPVAYRVRIANDTSSANATVFADVD